MRRRPPADSQGSLEFLLDTICNVFGGVLFIAILLVVLSRFADIRPASDTAGTLRHRQQQQELLALTAEREGLERSAAQRTRLASALAQQPNAPLIPVIEARQRENEGLRQQIATKEQTAAALAAQLSEALRGQDSAQQRIAATRARLAAAAASAAQARRERTYSLALPQLHVSRRPSTFWMIVRWNRLYLCFRPDNHNLADERYVRHSPAIGGDKYEPLPDRGIPLDVPDWEQSAEMRQLLSRLSPDRASVHFAVYPDSYETFFQVRNFFVTRGYDHNWVVMSDESELILTTSVAVDVQ